MKIKNRVFLMLALSGALASPAFADEPVVYPAKGQSAEQQNKDLSECKEWAKSTTGIDPAAPVQAAAPAEAAKGQRIRGAARGAAAGAVVGKVASDDAGKGAAVGAVVGAMAGGAKKRQQAREQKQQAEQQAQDKKNADLATHGRAVAACMEGRGYTVK